LDLQLAFDEKALLELNDELLKKALDIPAFTVTYDEKAEKARPGNPYISFSS
jgi:hypothetical protein